MHSGIHWRGGVCKLMKQRCAVIIKLILSLCQLCCHFGVKTIVERFIQSDPGGNSLAESVRTGWMEQQLPVLVLHCARDSAVPKKVTR